jgi:hypothetical protein
MDADEVTQLGNELAALASELPAPGDDGMLGRLAELAVKHIDGCDWASLTMVRGARGHTLAASDAIAAEVDRIQYKLADGPCLSAAANDGNYLIFDIAGETRWPRFTAAVAECTPVRSVLSFQLPAEESAALNLFAGSAGAFSDEDVTTGAVFAAYASILVVLHQRQDQVVNLQMAVQTNREIGIAIGVLMAHYKITKEDAFTKLREASQRLHVKLRIVAGQVVETGMLPDARPPVTAPAHLLAPSRVPR